MRCLTTLKQKAKLLKNEVFALAISINDPRTPWLAKIIICLTISYALSPIDLIPDFIPVIGYLDDLIIIPLLIMLSVKLIPNEVLLDSRKRVKEDFVLNKKIGYYSAIVIVLVWLSLFLFLCIKLLN